MVAAVRPEAADGGVGTAATRWYVLLMMVLVYTLSIADRYVISTVLEPIRLELQLTDSGIAFLTGVALALFYVVLGFPISYLIDRGNRRNIIAICLILWSAMTAFTRPVEELHAVADQPHRRRRGRGGRHARSQFDHLGLLSGRQAPDGADDLFARRAHRRVARRRHRRHHQRRLQLAHRVPRPRHPGRRRGPAHLPDDQGAAPRPARPQGRRQRGRVLRREHALPVDPEVRGARDGGERAHGTLGLGPHVVDAHVPDPQLRA